MSLVDEPRQITRDRGESLGRDARGPRTGDAWLDGEVGEADASGLIACLADDQHPYAMTLARRLESAGCSCTPSR